MPELTLDKWLQDRHRFKPVLNPAEERSNRCLDTLSALEAQEKPKIVKILRAKQQYKIALGCAVYRSDDPKTLPIVDLIFLAQSPKQDKDSHTNEYRERIRSPLTGVRAFCIECMGGSQGAVRECAGVNCPIWPFRMGNNPFFNRLADAEVEADDPEVEELPSLADITEDVNGNS